MVAKEVRYADVFDGNSLKWILIESYVILPSIGHHAECDVAGHIVVINAMSQRCIPFQ